MKKSTLLLLLFFLTCIQAFAQRGRVDSLLKAMPALPDSTRMKACYSIGYSYVNISIDSSAMYATKALELAKKLNNADFEARCYSLLGVGEKNRGNYEKAIAYHISSLKLNEARGDKRATAISYNDIGILYKNMMQLDKALGYYRRSNELCREIGLAKGVSMTYNNIGTIMKEKSMPDSSLRYYKLALGVAEKTGDTYSISTCLANIGEVYLSNKDYDAALSIFTRCLVYDKKNEDKEGMISSYIQIAQALGSVGNAASAMRYADSAYTLCAGEKLISLMPDILRIKAELNKKTGNYKAALALQERYGMVKDSIMGKETAKQVAELQTRYETEKKENEIASLKKQQQIDGLNLSKNELLLQKRNYEMLAIVGITVLLAAVAFLLYSRQQLRQRQAREKAVMDAEYKERLRIAKDVHDDLGSGLSKISLIAGMAQQKVTSSTALKGELSNIAAISAELNQPFDSTIDHMSGRMLDMSQGLSKISVAAQVAEQKAAANIDLGNDIRQIAAMSKDLVDNMRDLIWVLNPENTTLDNLVARLREYCADYLDGIASDATLNFPDFVDSLPVYREAQRNIFSTVKEALNNCIKYAGASAITIDLEVAAGQLSIYVHDNGRGMDMNNLKSTGNGLRNMRQRIETIGGNFLLSSHEGQGTQISITVPLKKISNSTHAVALKA